MYWESCSTVGHGTLLGELSAPLCVTYIGVVVVVVGVVVVVLVVCARAVAITITKTNASNLVSIVFN